MMIKLLLSLTVYPAAAKLNRWEGSIRNAVLCNSLQVTDYLIIYSDCSLCYIKASFPILRFVPL